MVGYQCWVGLTGKYTDFGLGFSAVKIDSLPSKKMLGGLPKTIILLSLLFSLSHTTSESEARAARATATNPANGSLIYLICIGSTA